MSSLLTKKTMHMTGKFLYLRPTYWLIFCGRLVGAYTIISSHGSVMGYPLIYLPRGPFRCKNVSAFGCDGCDCRFRGLEFFRGKRVWGDV